MADIKKRSLINLERSGLRLFLIIATLVFIAELLVMLFLSLLQVTAIVTKLLIDSLLLVVFISPALYLLIARPMVRYVNDQKTAEKTKETLFMISDSISSTDNLREMLGNVHKALGKLIDTTNFYVALYNEISDTFTFPFFVDRFDDDMSGAMKLKNSLTDYVRRTGKPLFADEKTTAELTDRGEIKLYGKYSPIWVGVPLKIHKKVIGVVALQSYDNPDNYNLKDLDLLTFVAGHLAAVIDRKIKEELLKNLSRAMEQNPASVVVTDTEGNIEYVNPGFTKKTGYSLEEVIGKNPRILKSGKTPEKTYEVMWRTLLGGFEWKGELLNRKKNGELFWESITISPIKDNSGKISHYVAVKEDITVRKEAEEKIEESGIIQNVIAKLLKISLEKLPLENQLERSLDVIFSNPLLPTIDRGCIFLVGDDPELLILKACNDSTAYPGEICHEVRFGECHCGRAALSKSVVYSGCVDESHKKREDCEEFLHGHYCVPIISEGEVIGVLNLYLRQKTELADNHLELLEAISDTLAGMINRKRGEEELRKAKDIAEATSRDLEFMNNQLKIAIERANQMAVAADGANRTKSEFLANISHEIRTPMNGIIGLTDLVIETDLNVEQREQLLVIKQCAENLLNLINDILDLSKIEAGQMELEEVEFSLYELVEKALDPFVPKADQKGLELILFVSPIVPTKVSGDPTRLQQIIYNLLANSVKFTEKGEVVLKVDLEAKVGDLARLHFSVADTGIGIPENRQEAIFESFTQGDGSTTRKYGGTGLGTTISKQIVEMMGGRIWIESPNKKDKDPGNPGTTMHFTIQLGSQEHDKKEETDLPVDMRGWKILIVDSNGTRRGFLGDLTAHWGLKPLSVESGKEALLALDRVEQKGEPFRILILDYNLADMGGGELIRNIKLHSIHKDVPIIIISNLRDRRSLEKSGYDNISAFIRKPVRQRAMLDAVRDLASGEGFPTNETGGKNLNQSDRIPDTDDCQCKVLVAEDDKVNQLLAAKLFNKIGCNVTIVENGKQAVEKAEKSDYDFIFLDIRMPVMGGVEAVKAIRNMEKSTGRRKTIIAMTAESLLSEKEIYTNAGMDDCIIKPIDQSSVTGILEKYGASIVSIRADEKSETKFKSKLNWNKILSRAADDPSILKNVIDVFLQDYPVMLNDLQKAVADKNPEEIEKRAHKLKGAVAVFEHEESYENAYELEKIGKSKNLEFVDLIFERLKCGLENLRDNLINRPAKSFSGQIK